MELVPPMRRRISDRDGESLEQEASTRMLELKHM
jgi:hypothetical protein